MEKKRRIRDYFVLYFSFLIYSGASVCAKYAALQNGLEKSFIFFGAEIVFLGIYALIWQQVLKRFPVGVAVSSKGIAVVIALVWSVLLFGEAITPNNIIGVILIVFGIWMVSKDE